MTEQIEISNAEWEVMRVIWTLGQATSRQLIEIMELETSNDQNAFRSVSR